MEIRWCKPTQSVFWGPGSLLVKGPKSDSSFCYYDGYKVTDFVYGNSKIKEFLIVKLSNTVCAKTELIRL